MKTLKISIAVLLCCLFNYSRADFHHMGIWSENFHNGSEIPLTGDFNGDKQTDIINFKRGTSGDVIVKLSEQNIFKYFHLTAGDPGDLFLIPQPIWHESFCYGTEVPLVGDFNHDGKDDIITFKRGADPKVYVATSTGSHFEGTGDLWHSNFCGGEATPLVGDFNGDGWDDIASVSAVWPYRVHVALNDQEGNFGTSTIWDYFFAPYGRTPLVGDFNGDDKDDIAEFTRGSSADVYVALSTGSAFGSRTKWHDLFCLGSETPRIGDLDGDGKDDILTFTHGTSADVFVALSNGEDTFEGTGLKWHDDFAAGSAIPAVGDFNGFGTADIIAFLGPGIIGDVEVAVTETNPLIDFTVEPFESGRVVYFERNDSTNTDYVWADFAFRFDIDEFKYGSNRIEKILLKTNNSPIKVIYPDDLTVNGSTAWAGEYTEHLLYRHHKDDRPTTITIAIYAKGVPSPKFNLYWVHPYQNDVADDAYLFPFKAEHLDDGEFYNDKGYHLSAGGCSQCYGHDIKVYKYTGGNWASKPAGIPTSLLTREDFYAWGKPVYAMADGTVNFCYYSEPDKVYGDDSYTYEHAGGNHLIIDHGEERVVYAHFMYESIPELIRDEGSTVTKGQFLGYIGFSGNTSEPHVHVTSTKSVGGIKMLRPIHFFGANTLAASQVADPDEALLYPEDWQYLDNRGLPPFKTLVYPIDDYFPDLPDALPETLIPTESRAENKQTGIKELGQLYPNPATDEVFITLKIEEKTTVLAQIYSVDGQLIYSKPKSEFNPGTHTLRLDLKDLANGTYIVHISKGTETIRKKLIIE